MQNITEIKKELYKSKAIAKFSHYVSGNLYYIVDVLDKTYLFPISTIETVVVGVTGAPMGTIKDVYETRLSSDLGTTTFSAEMKGSELIRWIQKAIDKNEFVGLRSANG